MRLARLQKCKKSATVFRSHKKVIIEPSAETKIESNNAYVFPYYRYYRYKDRRAPHPLDEVGFLNVAMHHLVQDEFQAKHRPNGVAPGGNLGGTIEAANSLKRGRSQSQIGAKKGPKNAGLLDDVL